MGTRNKDRRREKKQSRLARQRQRNSGAGRQDGSSATSQGSSLQVGLAIMYCAHAACEGRDAGPALATLTDRSRGSRWCALVTHEVRRVLAEHVCGLLSSGWEPRDVSSVLRHRLAPAPAALAEGVLPEAVRRSPGHPSLAARWQDQLALLATTARALDAEALSWDADVTSAVAAIGFLAHLGSLPAMVVPGTAGRRRPDLDPGFLDKVRGLLAKAEATAFEEEADAFLSKAQELMTRHNLDRAAIDDAARDGVPEVEARRCWLEDPYIKQKSLLLAVVARANRCRTVAVDEYGLVTVFGHPDDLSTSELLFTALLVHATNQMTLPVRGLRTTPPALGQAGSSRGRRSRASRPSYRRSFLVAFATRIGARLREAAGAATEAAVESTGGALLPVLANRQRHVDEAVAKMFPHTTTSDFSVTDREGWAAGYAAAELADLAWQPTLVDATG